MPKMSFPSPERPLMKRPRQELAEPKVEIGLLGVFCWFLGN